MIIFRSFMEKIILVLVAVAALSGCATTEKSSIENYIGLYEVVDSECEVAPGGSDPCAATLFFEITRGQFIGVKDNELAYVFWSGDPKVDSELQYTSQVIREHNLKSIDNNKYLLINDSETQEYLAFSDGNLVGYYVVYRAGDGFKRRSISYKLKSVRRGNLPQVRLNYPGNK